MMGYATAPRAMTSAVDQPRELLHDPHQRLQLRRVHYAIRHLHFDLSDWCALRSRDLCSLLSLLSAAAGLAPYFRYTQLPSSGFTLDYACAASDCLQCNGTWTNSSTACLVRLTRRTRPPRSRSLFGTFKAVGSTFLTTFVINKQSTVRYSLYLGSSGGSGSYNCYTQDGLNTSVPVTEARAADFATSTYE